MENTQCMACDVIKRASHYVKYWMSKQPGVREDSLTDWLLFDVSEKISWIKYVSFDNNIEGRTTGADWEWWFVYSDKSYGFRVQAKKLKDNNFKTFDYHNTKNHQIEQLIKDATARKLFPLYSFYPAGASSQVACCKDIRDEGVYLADANKMKALYDNAKNISPKKVTSAEVLKPAIPLSCMLCCQANSSENIIKKYLTSSGNNQLGVHTKIPAYIKNILNGVGDLKEYLEEYKTIVDTINGIMVVDLRES